MVQAYCKGYSSYSLLAAIGRTQCENIKIRVHIRLRMLAE